MESKSYLSFTFSYCIPIPWASPFYFILFAIWLDIRMFGFIASPLCWPIKVLTWWGFWLFLMATATLVLSSIMAIITWVLMVKTNELSFVFMFHAFWVMEIPQTFNQLPFGPFFNVDLFSWWTNIFLLCRLGYVLQWAGPLGVGVQFPHIASFLQIGN